MMPNTRSLRFRLAVWYFCTVAIICGVAAGGYWFGVRTALDDALDQGLRYRLVGLQDYLEGANARTPQEIAASLDRLYPIGELYQVYGGDGRLIAQSRGLARHDVKQPPPRELGAGITYETAGPRNFPLRLAWQKATIAGQPLILNAADPQRKFGGVLDAFTSVLLLSMPLILTLAIICGVWLGRRALAPVARISEDARAITDQNLSARLAVPDSRDELQQLSETLNAMLERIERSFMRIRQFTADASHELRAPMTLIHTAAECSLRKERSREDLAESMQKILRESKRTTALIDDLLLLARGDALKGIGTLLPIDAAPLLRDLVEQAAIVGAGKKIDVTLDVRSEALPVHADEVSLRRLLLILIDNAIKFTPDGGVVSVSGRKDAAAAHVEISVADTGPGITPDDASHIFERFWRADKVRGRESGGAGLGLPIARQIAEWHNATLSVESKIGTVESKMGSGSVFTVRLPG